MKEDTLETLIRKNDWNPPSVVGAVGPSDDGFSKALFAGAELGDTKGEIVSLRLSRTYQRLLILSDVRICHVSASNRMVSGIDAVGIFYERGIGKVFTSETKQNENARSAYSYAVVHIWHKEQQDQSKVIIIPTNQCVVVRINLEPSEVSELILRFEKNQRCVIKIDMDEWN